MDDLFNASPKYIRHQSQLPTRRSIDEMIARLEAATEGSDELDSAISDCVSGQTESYGCYTRSVDFALTLVPEGFAVRDFSIWPKMRSTVTVLGAHLESDGLYWHHGGDGRWEAEGATPALALCIAALKARAALAPEPPR